jgi:hypothetical protein
MIDQYQVTEDTHSGIKLEPNRNGDQEYIIRLIEQIVRLSVESVKSPPDYVRFGRKYLYSRPNVCPSR